MSSLTVAPAHFSFRSLQAASLPLRHRLWVRPARYNSSISAFVQNNAVDLRSRRNQPAPIQLTAASGLKPGSAVADVSQLVGWQVVKTDSQPVGTVVEVVQPTADPQASNPVLRAEFIPQPHNSVHATAPQNPPIQHLIPWAHAIIQGVQPSTRTIVIDPPAGLLELGQREHLAEQLRPQLEPYGRPPEGSMAQRLGQHFMPTGKQLKAAGRQDLVKQVVAAGGFTEVAHRLGLRARRRPQGFWDDVSNVDQELSMFVAGMWTALQSVDGTYFYNQITGAQQWARPQPPQSIPIDDAGTVIFAEEEAQRVMPSRSVVLAAGRFDLHHGIMYQGGYRAVAKRLGRPPVWPRVKKYTSVRQLARALQGFMKEHGLERKVFPPASVLRAADRTDLLNGINEHGGLFVLGPRLGMATSRGPGWPDIATAAQALHQAAQQLDSSNSNSGNSNNANSKRAGQQLHMPTIQQLRDAGRGDLIYAVQKFGHQEIADAAGLVGGRSRGRPARLAVTVTHTVTHSSYTCM